MQSTKSLSLVERVKMRPLILVLCAIISVVGSASTSEARIFGRHRGSHGSCGGNGRSGSYSPRNTVYSPRYERSYDTQDRSYSLSEVNEWIELLERLRRKTESIGGGQGGEGVDSGSGGDGSLDAIAGKLDQIEQKIDAGQKYSEGLHANTAAILQRIGEHLARERSRADDAPFVETGEDGGSDDWGTGMVDSDSSEDGYEAYKIVEIMQQQSAMAENIDKVAKMLGAMDKRIKKLEKSEPKAGPAKKPKPKKPKKEDKAPAVDRQAAPAVQQLPLGDQADEDAADPDALLEAGIPPTP